MKDTREVQNSFYVDPLYLKHDNEGTVPDFRNWQIPLGRRFRSLKLWFTFRALGVNGLRENIRKMCQLTNVFKRLVENDSRFEIAAPVYLGLVCFRLKGSNELNEKLVKLINESGEIHITAASLRDVYVIRFSISSTLTTEQDVHCAWMKICEIVDSGLLDAFSI